ncbi:MAG TPA: RsmE family RNA methyltransferase [Terriglobales bacterium]|nr:RsmE family RNA methyltransferase [Terriglobales bacterium]
MTRRRWIADQLEGDHALLLGQNAHHLSRVLRAKAGQEFDIVCGDAVRVGRIATIDDDRVVFDLGESVPQKESRAITLVLAIFKFDRMEWAIEKAVELGVSSIQPVIARRTDAHLATAAGKRAERWRRIAHEAAQQSRRVSIPMIADPAKLRDVLEQPRAAAIILAETEEELSLTQALANAKDSPLALAVGPEGGWTDEELEQFRAAGWISASLGHTVLRAETAAIAALAIATAFPQE